MSAYYNEIEPYAAQWLRNLIKEGLIADGEVDTRSIVDVSADELRGYTQCHFFAGIGGWSLALRLAGWSDDRPVWTGSCPCQPFSSAGQQKGQEDERHLWPVFFNLISAVRPTVVMGVQVAAAVGKSWLDGVCSDLEGIGYATGAAVVPACAVNAPHRRDRLWFVADTKRLGREVEVFDAGSCGEEGGIRQTSRSGMRSAFDVEHENVGDANMPYSGRGGISGGIYSGHADTDGRSICGHWDTYQWAIGSDGKTRRVKPGVRLLANGVPARVGKLRAYGNAIVPQVAAEVIKVFMETEA